MSTLVAVFVWVRWVAVTGRGIRVGSGDMEDGAGLVVVGYGGGEVDAVRVVVSALEELSCWI